MPPRRGLAADPKWDGTGRFKVGGRVPMFNPDLPQSGPTDWSERRRHSAPYGWGMPRVTFTARADRDYGLGNKGCSLGCPQRYDARVFTVDDQAADAIRRAYEHGGE